MFPAPRSGGQSQRGSGSSSKRGTCIRSCSGCSCSASAPTA
ncbi:hypothetical protein R2601_04073 [Salipiger bermudensis HTCC2601]|uniref:Uncharacterized protein n=1 Tax=Salipiger bermudensis (strain DSM 26914 / JCM 13377 / KCTC 12554 / HTCC2601) TaxID=314265 RepID=Q0FW31_SALBH|nr:hypothetical protein R2601_04073 [Salipiger bermudensis HTCC2601]